MAEKPKSNRAPLTPEQIKGNLDNAYRVLNQRPNLAPLVVKMATDPNTTLVTARSEEARALVGLGEVTDAVTSYIATRAVRDIFAGNDGGANDIRLNRIRALIGSLGTELGEMAAECGFDRTFINTRNSGINLFVQRRDDRLKKIKADKAAKAAETVPTSVSSAAAAHPQELTEAVAP
jgi:hypothetical protein